MRVSRLILMVGVAASLVLTGCGTVEVGLSTPGSLASATAPVGATGAPTTAPAAPTATVEAGVLPRPLYFLSEADHQIWRLEPNGRTLTQITRERAPITDFDVSPADGALAYIAENTLVRADLHGGDRRVLLTGPALTGEEYEGITSQITAPRWSMDGTQIAFGLNGANVIAAAGGEARMLQASDPVPQGRSLARFFRPYAWSPDGQSLLLWFNYWMEGGGYGVYNLSDGSLVEVNACCQPVWSRDGRRLFFTSADANALNPPGLFRAEASTGAVQALIAKSLDEGGTMPLFAFPHEADDGSLLYLMELSDPNADGVYLWPQHFRLYRAGSDGVTGQEAISAEAHTAVDALWAEDGSGVVIREIDAEALPEWVGELVWLPADGKAAVTLPTDGTLLRWGR